MGIYDATSDELESSFLEVFAESIGFRRSCRDVFHRFATVLDGSSSHKLPDVVVETTELLLHGEKSLGIRDGGRDLESISNDAWILEEGSDFSLVEARDLGRIEVGESLAVGVALVQHGGPAQSRLSPLEDEKLEVLPIVVNRNPPLRVVISQVELTDTFRPSTPLHSPDFSKSASLLSSPTAFISS